MDIYIAFIAIAVFSWPTASQSASVDEWTVPARIAKNDTFWANCSGHMDGQEKFAGYAFLKDNQLFYKYENQTKPTAQIFSVLGLSKYQLDAYDRLAGVLRIRDAHPKNRGDYQCQLMFRQANGAYSKTTRNVMVEFTDKSAYPNGADTSGAAVKWAVVWVLIEIGSYYFL